jgi:hypothetical protein
LIGLDLFIRLARSFVSRQWAWLQSWKITLRVIAISAACSWPIIVYTSVSFLNDPFLRGWTAQNIILSPPPVDYLMAYIILIPLCLVGTWWVIRHKVERFYPLLGWILLIPILAYFPVAIQRRLPEGSWAALIAVAVFGLSNIRKKVQPLLRTALYASLLPTMILFLGGFMTLTQLKVPVYRPAEEIQAFEFLRQSANNFPVVLASFDTSNALPAWAPVRTLIGHGPESIGLARVQPRVEAFFHADLSPAEEAQLFEEFSIRYLIWGPAERALGSRNPVNSPGAKLVFQNTTYQVFEVMP